MFGAKFKIVTGYAGGTEINIAMERGEVQRPLRLSLVDGQGLRISTGCATRASTC